MRNISEVYFGDRMDYMARFSDKYFDVAIIDPEYGINSINMQMGSAPNGHGKGQYPGISTAVKLKGRLNSGGGKLKNRMLNQSEIDWDNTPPPPEFFEEVFRVSKHQIIWGGNYFDLPPTRCIICWDKMQPWDNFSQWEMAWTSFDKPAKMYRISNTGGANRGVKIHPTQKPVELYDNIYRDFITEDMYVLDTGLGSGSNRIAAFKANVNFFSCENNKLYYQLEQQRFNEFKKQIRINF